MGGKRKIRKKGGFPFLRILMFYNARIDTHYRACTIFNNYRGMLPIPAGGGIGIPEHVREKTGSPTADIMQTPRDSITQATIRPIRHATAALETNEKCSVVSETVWGIAHISCKITKKEANMQR